MIVFVFKKRVVKSYPEVQKEKKEMKLKAKEEVITKIFGSN